MPGPVEPYELCEYETTDGHVPFAEWLRDLRDHRARARIDARLARVRLGNLGDYQSVGEGVYELRIFYGPGYRVFSASTMTGSFCCCAAATNHRSHAISPRRKSTGPITTGEVTTNG